MVLYAQHVHHRFINSPSAYIKRKLNPMQTMQKYMYRFIECKKRSNLARQTIRLTEITNNLTMQLGFGREETLR